MTEEYTRNDSGMCINTNTAPYHHILDRRSMSKRIQKLEGDVGGIANSINTLIDMIQRADNKKLERNEEN